MFKNVKSIWNTWNLNWYIGSFIFSVLTVIMFPLWIYMIVKDFWEWFSSHAANQSRARTYESGNHQLRMMIGNHKEPIKNWMQSILVIKPDKDNNLIIVFKLNDDTTITRRISEKQLRKEYGDFTARGIMRRHHIQPKEKNYYG